MDRAAFENELKIRLRQELWATLTPLGRAVHKTKAIIAKRIEEERRHEDLQNTKRKG